jgi:hypothetical protein
VPIPAPYLLPRAQPAGTASHPHTLAP